MNDWTEGMKGINAMAEGRRERGEKRRLVYRYKEGEGKWGLDRKKKGDRKKWNWE